MHKITDNKFLLYSFIIFRIFISYMKYDDYPIHLMESLYKVINRNERFIDLILLNMFSTNK